MLLHHLQRIEAFAHIPQTELRAVARQSHIMCLPPGRWLIRENKSLDAYFYLIRGRLRIESRARSRPACITSASSFGSLKHFYPGQSGAVRTLTHCQVLRISQSLYDFLCRGQAPGAVCKQSTEFWLHRFLSSHMMDEVPRETWQRIVRGFTRRAFTAGETVIRKGQPADACYVVESGHAVIHRGGQTLRHLNPGDFFGEDALISHAVRNADVTSLEALVLHQISKQAFRRELLAALVSPVSKQVGGRLIELGRSKLPCGETLQLEEVRNWATTLQHDQTYYITGSDFTARQLCAFILLQQGLRAHPIQ